MALVEKLSTWGRLMHAADEPKAYVFEDDEPSQRVVPIPISMDKKLETLRSLKNLLVEIQAEEHRIERERQRIEADIARHEAAIWDLLRDHGIAPQPPRIPEKPE